MGTLFIKKHFNQLIKMENDEGKNVELYVPRKCCATNQLITAKDHASVQINVGHIDENGVYTGEFTPVAFAGYVRAKSEADQAMNVIAAKHGLMKDLSAFPAQHRFTS